MSGANAWSNKVQVNNPHLLNRLFQNSVSREKSRKMLVRFDDRSRSLDEANLKGEREKRKTKKVGGKKIPGYAENAWPKMC